MSLRAWLATRFSMLLFGAMVVFVFAIYLADAIGYTGSVGVQLFKDMAQSDISRLSFFKNFTYLMSVVGTFCLIWSCLYFLRKERQAQASEALLQAQPAKA